MPITAEHVGRTYPPSAPYEVSAAKIAEFARALGEGVDHAANPAYGGETPVAPPTFAVVMAAQTWDALFGDAELELSLQRTMHGDQTFTYSRPLRTGDRIASQLTIDKVRLRAPMEWITIRVDLATVEGEHVCTATSTLLHTREETQEDPA